MATHSSIPVWKIPWTGEHGGLQFMGSQRVRYNWETEHTDMKYILMGMNCGLTVLLRCSPNIVWLPFFLVTNPRWFNHLFSLIECAICIQLSSQGFHCFWFLAAYNTHAGMVCFEFIMLKIFSAFSIYECMLS